MRSFALLLALLSAPAFAQYYEVQNADGGTLTRRSKLRFTGATCADTPSANATTCTVSSGSGVNTPELIYKTAAGQSIPNGTVTTIDFGTVVVDTDAVVTTGASWKATLPAGTYAVDVVVTYVLAAGAPYDSFVDINVNGSLEMRGPRTPGTVPIGGTVVGNTASTTIRLTTTSDVSASLYQSTGATRTLETGGGQTNRITIRRVR